MHNVKYQKWAHKNLNANLKVFDPVLWTYPPAQEPEAAPPFSIHSADVKQVPFRKVLPEPLLI